METKITKMLGIEHPIIQGGMHYVGFAEEIKEPVWGLYLETTYLSVSQAIPDSLYL